MAFNSKIFSKVPVDIPNKSGFHMGHSNMFTGTPGTLIPVLCDELLPGDEISCGISSEVQLPPMATDFYGRVRMKFDSFFVPNRILDGRWKFAFENDDSAFEYYFPSAFISCSDIDDLGFYFGPGSLADYLCCNGVNPQPATQIEDEIPAFISNVLPFVAYHKIWDDWYRDSRIQKDIFSEIFSDYIQDVVFKQGSVIDDVPNQIICGIGSLPRFQTGRFLSFDGQSDLTIFPYIATDPSIYGSGDGCIYPLFNDGFSLFDLRQRNYQRDYFTNCTPEPQAGDSASVGIDFDSGSFTIASLRAANSLQLWMERNNIAGARYGDRIRAQYGVYPSDAVTNRAIYLGSQEFDVYNKSVYQSVSAESPGPNPFDSVGSKYASPLGVGSGDITNGTFVAKEHGFFMIIASLCPDSNYCSGRHRMFNRNVLTDVAFPLLAGVGDQPVFVGEIDSSNNPSFNDFVFGYNQRYAEYKFKNDEIHGLLRDGESLSSFSLKRSFDYSVELGSEFLEISKNSLDEVLAVPLDGQVIDETVFWCNTYFDYKKVSTLPAYSIPTLGDMKDTHIEIIPNGGSRL